MVTPCRRVRQLHELDAPYRYTSVSTLCPSPSSPAVALLESEDLLGYLFSGLWNIQLCADTPV